MITMLVTTVKNNMVPMRIPIKINAAANVAMIQKRVAELDGRVEDICFHFDDSVHFSDSTIILWPHSFDEIAYESNPYA